MSELDYGNDHEKHIKKEDVVTDIPECPYCGSIYITILEDRDICHDCGFVYT